MPRLKKQREQKMIERKKKDKHMKTIMFSTRLLPEELDKIRAAGFGCLTAGLRRLIAEFEKSEASHAGKKIKR